MRELENLVRRLSAIYSQDIVTGEMVENELASVSRAPFNDTTERTGDLSESVERFLSDYFMGFGQELPPSGLYTRVLRKVEFPLITAALAATRGIRFAPPTCSGSTATLCVRKFATSALRSFVSRASSRLEFRRKLSTLAPDGAKSPHLCSCRQGATL